MKGTQCDVICHISVPHFPRTALPCQQDKRFSLFKDAVGRYQDLFACLGLYNALQEVYLGKIENQGGWKQTPKFCVTDQLQRNQVLSIHSEN